MDYDQLLRDFCSELSRKGVSNFIYYDDIRMVRITSENYYYAEGLHKVSIDHTVSPPRINLIFIDM